MPGNAGGQASHNFWDLLVSEDPFPSWTTRRTVTLTLDQSNSAQSPGFRVLPSGRRYGGMRVRASASVKLANRSPVRQVNEPREVSVIAPKSRFGGGLIHLSNSPRTAWPVGLARRWTNWPFSRRWRSPRRETRPPPPRWGPRWTRFLYLRVYFDVPLLSPSPFFLICATFAISAALLGGMR